MGSWICTYKFGVQGRSLVRGKHLGVGSMLIIFKAMRAHRGEKRPWEETKNGVLRLCCLVVLLEFGRQALFTQGWNGCLIWH